ncbi:MAG: Mur ligase family protein [Agromyces sp.]
MKFAPAVAIGRAVRVAARIRKPGGGSAIPGAIVNRIAPSYLPETLARFPDGLVIVTGSSGKSTTTKMLVAVLRAHGLRVFTNPSTANIAQGLTSALLEASDWRGAVPGDIAVLEMDEGHGAKLAPLLRASVVVLTNVMVDQIDRFFDSDLVAKMLGVIAGRAEVAVVSNADDALLEHQVAKLPVPVDRYGVSEDVLAAAPRGLGYTRTAVRRLSRATAEAIIVERVAGDVAQLYIDGALREVSLPARGTHYATDAAAALSAARRILADRWQLDIAVSAIGAVEPVFARGERAVVKDQVIDFVLVQNPASFQLNVDAISGSADCILFALGSDVRDPSYFWPVDAGALGRVEIVSGAKPEEAALMLAYDGVEISEVEPNLEHAIDRWLALPTPPSGVKTIVFTADSMRRTRRYLGLTQGAS